MLGQTRRLTAIALLLVAVAPPVVMAAPGDGAVVLAAASLRESLTAAAKAYVAKGKPRPTLSFAGSSALARQIEQGAPADLFISADEAWMDYLANCRLIVERTRASFLSNRLVLIGPASQRLKVDVRPGFPLGRLLGDGHLSMADVNAVPAGRYGKAALTALGVWQAVEGRVVQSDNVRAAMTFVERGEAPLGVVYATDARASTKVAVVGVFPRASHPPISYPVAQLRASKSPEASAFRAFLLSREGRAIFVNHGFGAR